MPRLLPALPPRRLRLQREKETLTLIAQGKTNKEIADALIVSVNTVRAHVRSLMQKLNLENRTQLAINGLREGFGLKGGADGRSTGNIPSARTASPVS